jgi:hypothetical protein
LSLKNLVKKHKLFAMILIAALAVVLIGSNFTPVQQSLIYTPGWEIYNQICAIQCAAGIKSGPAEFTSPREVGGAAYWKFDVDAPNYGEPTIMIETTDLRHTNTAGTQIPNEQTVSTKTVTRGNHTYYLDYHIYMFEVTIRTVADRVTIDAGSALFVPMWEHETSWGCQRNNAIVPTSYGHVGKPFQGGVYVKFVIDPWTGEEVHTAPSEDYVSQGAWAGVMNSYIYKKVEGQVENQYKEGMPTPNAEAPLTARGNLDNGYQVNMYIDNGAFSTQAPTVNWDENLSPDSRILSTAVLYLPIQLEAGAYLTKDILGAVWALTPCDAYVKYTVRVDVLQSHDFVLQTAYEPPIGTTPTDYFTWAKGFWDSLFSSPNFYFFIIIIAILIAMWIMFRGKKGGKNVGMSKRYYGLTMFDLCVVAVLGLLTFIPDPTDLLDAGLPIVEPIGALAYWFLRRKGGGKKS